MVVTRPVLLSEVCCEEPVSTRKHEQHLRVSLPLYGYWEHFRNNVFLYIKQI